MNNFFVLYLKTRLTKQLFLKLSIKKPLIVVLPCRFNLFRKFSQLFIVDFYSEESVEDRKKLKGQKE